MVRCNIPCCFDDMCHRPYPGDPGYSTAVQGRNRYMQETELAAKKQRKEYEEMLRRTPELIRDKNNILTLNGKPMNVISWFHPQFIYGYTEFDVFHQILWRAENLKAEAFEQGAAGYIKRGGDSILSSESREYYRAVQYYKFK